MSLTACFYHPNGQPRGVPGPWQVERCTWAAVGGPDEVVLRLVEPSGADLAHLDGLLGCPLELWDTVRGLPAWWGYIATLEIHRGSLHQRLSLDGLINRVAVSYLQTAAGQAGGRPILTEWAEDTVSIDLFGIHESIPGLGEASREQAEALRDAVLLQSAHPRPQAGRLAEYPAENPQIQLRGRGWWQALGRRHLAFPPAREECRPAGAGVQLLGTGGNNQKIAQSITPASTGWAAQEVWLQVRKQGSPGDSLRVELAADAGGAPGTLLGSAELAGSALPADFRWVRFPLASPVLVEGPLWLVLSRTGSLSSANHYRLRVDETCPYAGGVLLLWNGSAWVNRSPAADLAFQLAGGMETSSQMIRLAAAAVPPLAGVQALAASGVFSDPFCSGLRSLQAELEELLSGAAGGVRWLAQVSSQRQVIFAPQPPADAPRFRLGMDGVLRLPDGRPASPVDEPAGQWVAVEGGQPVFLERVAWRDGFCNTEKNRMKTD